MSDDPEPTPDEKVRDGMNALAEKWAERDESDAGTVMSDAERARAFRWAVLLIGVSLAVGVVLAIVLYVLDR